VAEHCKVLWQPGGRALGPGCCVLYRHIVVRLDPLVVLGTAKGVVLAVVLGCPYLPLRSLSCRKEGERRGREIERIKRGQHLNAEPERE
jgi:hypothetical protein